MPRNATWVLLLLVLVPGLLSSSCEEGCTGDCSAVAGASSVAPPPAAGEPLTLACASRGAGPAAELEWELTVGGGAAPYAYTIDFGDGTAPAAGSWPASGVHRGSHGYGRPGDFPFAAQVRDAGGRTRSCAMVATAPASGLELACTATPRTGAAPLRVTFDAPPEGRRGCLGSCTVSWSFGDGSGSEGGRAVHEYAVGSTTYDAVATLHDGPERRARCRVPIEVRSAEAAPEPNRPPVIDALAASPTSIAAGQSATISGSVSDPDTGDTTTWSLSLSGPANAGSLEPQSGSGPIVSRFTSAGGVTGNVTITATAVDAQGATAHRNVTVSVTAPNRPPVITSLTAIPPLIFAQPGGGSIIQGSMMDPDGDPLTWKFERVGGGIGYLGEPSGTGTSATTSFWTGPSLFGGSCTARLTARDPGGLTDVRTVTIYVLEVGLQP